MKVNILYNSLSTKTCLNWHKSFIKNELRSDWFLHLDLDDVLVIINIAKIYLLKNKSLLFL